MRACGTGSHVSCGPTRKNYGIFVDRSLWRAIKPTGKGGGGTTVVPAGFTSAAVEATITYGYL